MAPCGDDGQPSCGMFLVHACGQCAERRHCSVIRMPVAGEAASKYLIRAACLGTIASACWRRPALLAGDGCRPSVLEAVMRAQENPDAMRILQLTMTASAGPVGIAISSAARETIPAREHPCPATRTTYVAHAAPGTNLAVYSAARRCAWDLATCATQRRSALHAAMPGSRAALEVTHASLGHLAPKTSAWVRASCSPCFPAGHNLVTHLQRSALMYAGTRLPT